MKRAAIISASVAAALAAVGAAYWAGLQHGQGAQPAPAQASAPQDARKPLYWHDPMVPGQRFDKPGKSPFMDMQLVPSMPAKARRAAWRSTPARARISACAPRR